MIEVINTVAVWDAAAEWEAISGITEWEPDVKRDPIFLYTKRQEMKDGCLEAEESGLISSKAWVILSPFFHTFISGEKGGW